MNPRSVDRQVRTAIDHVADGVLVEAGDTILYINESYARLLGYPSTTELLGATIRDIAHPDDLERLRWFGRCRQEGKPAPTRYTFRGRSRGGEFVMFDASVSNARVDGEVLITTIVRELKQLAPDAQPELELPGMQRLSPREVEIIRHLLQGRRSKEIAMLLNISEKTICTHRARAFQKLALRGINDLFRVAAERGVLLNGSCA
ncbi:MAG TPA: LuxR C-terminal-related transcriptional regulator [Thermoanaerobaculia bacterium]|jgi:PAS domain S-box-containing protein